MWIIGLSAVFAMVVAWMHTLPSPWATWAPATCMPGHCFCEALTNSLVRQPVNAMTSLAFVTVAIWVMQSAFGKSSVSVRADDGEDAGANSRARVPRILESRVYSALFAAALVVIGLGSTFYHSSLTFVGQTADVLGMYLLGTFVLLFAFTRTYAVKPVMVAVLYVGGNAVLLTTLVLIPELRRYAFGAVVLAALAMEWKSRRAEQALGDERGDAQGSERENGRGDVRLLLAAVGALTLGFAIWVTDITGLACDPHSLLQGHGAWHILGAVSAALVYRYYLSERDDVR